MIFTGSALTFEALTMALRTYAAMEAKSNRKV